ncbi:DUF58 domain-containing protein [Noviherbaspirillum sp. Root189]|uniref:DUF58 domain-containing protein n=1 Tax=Noviherbaspirillum sp. Root189 TaxID=1736487 RepID=UPI000708FC85|nr:hypothetical protein [Noviherbaspirillum sp. Root189]KRB87450.1 MxaS protein [Noviherbaspirillum sp. Root189]
MDDIAFFYRIPGRSGGHRPGAHQASTNGAGHAFHSHARLLDLPDSRRLDVRASLRAGRGEWLVRAYRQRAAISLRLVVDVSASMQVGAPLRKLDIAARIAESAAHSAFGVGDTVGMLAFDAAHREDLYFPAMHSRGAGQQMRLAIAACNPSKTAGCALVETVRQLAGRRELVFLVSDFHWPLAVMAEAMDMLSHAWVVPLVVWDQTELAPPPVDGFVTLRDAETGAATPVWVNARLRQRWAAQLASRRRALDALFGSRNLLPLYLHGGFDAAALSRYFLELVP